jgi:hypothetical protein
MVLLHSTAQLSASSLLLQWHQAIPVVVAEVLQGLQKSLLIGFLAFERVGFYFTKNIQKYFNFMLCILINDLLPY